MFIMLLARKLRTLGAMIAGACLAAALASASAEDTQPLSSDDRDQPAPIVTPQQLAEKAEKGQPADEPADKPADIAGRESAAEPGDDEQEPVRVKALAFNRVEAGTTTADTLKEKWGKPIDVLPGADQQVWTYEIKPFPKVDVTVVDDVVASILIHLGTRVVPSDVAKQLKLDKFEPVPIPDEFGEVLGQAFPERGVLFVFSSDDEVAGADRILLEPITGQPFALRAEYNALHRYENGLRDLDHALRLDPADARAHWLRARILAETGRPREALDSISHAVRLEPDSSLYLLCEARLLAGNGEDEKALRQIQRVLAVGELEADIAAAAQCLYGDLLISGPTRDYKAAIAHHQKAVDLAGTLVDDQRWMARRRAKQILIDAHLAIATDVAGGNFRRKPEVVAKWIDRAEQLAEDCIRRDNGDAAVRLAIHQRALAAYALTKGAIDPAERLEMAVKEADRLFEQAADPMERHRVRWQPAMAVISAVESERALGKHAAALEHAGWAVELIEAHLPHRQSTIGQDYLVGRLYFLVGSLHAVQRNAHKEAVVWYEKALPLLDRPMPECERADMGRHGERFVSMGVSYWSEGQQDKGLQLTEQGVAVMQQAVDRGVLEASTLSVPFGNLATMHKELGNQQVAQRYAGQAAELGDERPVRSARADTDDSPTTKK